VSLQEFEPTDAERRVQQAVRDLPRAEADHAFRERLGRDFAAGRIGERREIALTSPRRRAWAWVLAPVAAAAAIVLAIGLNRAPGWIVTASLGEGSVAVDGRPVSSGHLDELARLVRAGVRVRTSEGVVLRLASRGFGMIEIAPGSDVTLPAAPGRWFARSVQAEVQGGVARFSTAPAFHGARLAIMTPEAQVQVVGTTFAVLAMPVGTCVCVLDGHVKMAERGNGSMVAIAPGMRHEIFNTGQPAMDDRMLAPQVKPLTALRAETMRTMGEGR
jgi:ferric-dicitrate binding protein FerR (iron transport regulator)